MIISGVVGSFNLISFQYKVSDTKSAGKEQPFAAGCDNISQRTDDLSIHLYLIVVGFDCGCIVTCMLSNIIYERKYQNAMALLLAFIFEIFRDPKLMGLLKDMVPLDALPPIKTTEVFLISISFSCVLCARHHLRYKSKHSSA